MKAILVIYYRHYGDTHSWAQVLVGGLPEGILSGDFLSLPFLKARVRITGRLWSPKHGLVLSCLHPELNWNREVRDMEVTKIDEKSEESVFGEDRKLPEQKWE